MDWTEIEVVVKNQFEDNIVGILYLFDIDGINIKDSRDYEEFAKKKPYWVVLDEEDFEKSDFITVTNPSAINLYNKYNIQTTCG